MSTSASDNKQTINLLIDGREHHSESSVTSTSIGHALALSARYAFLLVARYPRKRIVAHGLQKHRDGADILAERAVVLKCTGKYDSDGAYFFMVYPFSQVPGCPDHGYSMNTARQIPGIGPRDLVQIHHIDRTVVVVGRRHQYRRCIPVRKCSCAQVFRRVILLARSHGGIIAFRKSPTRRTASRTAPVRAA